MECSVCKRSDLELVEALYDNEITSLCRQCAEMEGAMIINKPTQEQLAAVHKRLPLTETIARMNNPRFVKTMSHDQSVANRNLAKIRFPVEKQKDAKLMDNYYWELQMARRRKKWPISEVAKITHVPESVIAGLEHGILPPNFEPLIKNLELALGIRLLKSHEHSVRFKMPERPKAEGVSPELAQEIEKELQAESSVIHRHEKPAVQPSAAPAPAPLREPRQHTRTMDVLNRIASGKADFSKENMSSINVRDLAGSERRQMPEGWSQRHQPRGHQLESQKQQKEDRKNSPSSSDEPDIEFFE